MNLLSEDVKRRIRYRAGTIGHTLNLIKSNWSVWQKVPGNGPKVEAWSPKRPDSAKKKNKADERLKEEDTAGPDKESTRSSGLQTTTSLICRFGLFKASPGLRRQRSEVRQKKKTPPDLLLKGFCSCRMKLVSYFHTDQHQHQGPSDRGSPAL